MAGEVKPTGSKGFNFYDDYYDVDDVKGKAQDLGDVDVDDDDVEGEDEDLIDDNDSDEEDEDGEVADSDSKKSSKEESEEDSEEDDDDNASGDVHTPMFTEGQQEKINQIVQTRLDRQRRSLENELVAASGVDMEGMEEIKRATRLWGILKDNPNLSASINQLIDTAIQKGQARIPKAKETHTSDKMADITKREAILDMKSSDNVFARYSKEILSWAEQEGYEITDEKSLKLVYNAWKGANSARLGKTKSKATAQKQQQKKAAIKKATTQKGTSKRRSAKPRNYAKMSDIDILNEEGIDLFVED